MKKVLILTPHADDSELGMGGTIAKLVEEGNRVTVLLLATHRTQDDERVKQFEEAIIILGAEPLVAPRSRFHDGNMGNLHRDSLVGYIDEVKNSIRPDTIFLPFPATHQDHMAVYEAGLASARISLSESQKHIDNIYVYREPVSKIDVYNTGLNFSLYVPLKKHHIDLKKQALYAHKTEILPYPHASSPEYAEYEARTEGGVCGNEFAEVFASVRSLL